MTRADTARLSYQAARDEILERLRLREQFIGYYLAGAATLFTVAFGNDVASDARVYLPGLVSYLSLAVTLLVVQHMDAIHFLADFCRTAVHEALAKEMEDAPQWDRHTRDNPARESGKSVLRVVSHLFLIQGPGLLGLLVMYPRADGAGQIAFASFALVAWLAGLVLSIRSLLRRLRSGAAGIPPGAE